MEYWLIVIGAVVSAVVFIIAQHIYDLIMDERKTGKPTDMDFTGDWYVAWETTADGDKKVVTERIAIKQKRNKLMIENDAECRDRGLSPLYPWRGECEVYNGTYILGNYLPRRKNLMARGVMYFKVVGSKATNADCLVGKWAGFNEVSDFEGGYGVIAIERDIAEQKIKELILGESDGWHRLRPRTGGDIQDNEVTKTS